MRTVRKSAWPVWLTLLILLLALDHTAAAEISGRVVGITDGDTLTVLMDRKQIGSSWVSGWWFRRGAPRPRL
jgi:endonuclease YncB( thermonuclease family)